MAEYKEVIIHKVDLKKLRKKAGLSLKKLEKKSGVSFTQISAYERGKMRMSEPIWRKLSKVLDTYEK